MQIKTQDLRRLTRANKSIMSTIDKQRFPLERETVHVLSSEDTPINITTAQMQILAHGLKWVPHQDLLNARQPLVEGIEDLIARAKLQADVTVDEDVVMSEWKEALEYAKDKSLPHPFMKLDADELDTDPIIAPYAETMRELWPSDETKFDQSLSEAQRIVKRTIQDLKEAKHWVIKPSDKNQGLCVIHQRMYTGMVYTLVQDAQTYAPMSELEAQNRVMSIVNHWQTIMEKFDDVIKGSSEWTEIVSFAAKPMSRLLKKKVEWTQFAATLYAMPKVHKKKKNGVYPCRPLVQGFATLQARLNRVLARVLYPLLASTDTAILETQHARDLIQKSHFPEDVRVYSADVEALYPNVPTDLVPEAYLKLTEHLQSQDIELSNWITDETWKKLMVELIRWSLNPVVIKTVLPRGTSYYEQSQGLPMGFSLSPWAACVTLWAMCEHKAREMIRSQCWMMGRYIDDVILVIRNSSELKSVEEVQRWLIGIYTDQIPTIKLTVQAGDGLLTFLDLDLITDRESVVSGGKILTKCHHKEMSTFQYVEPSSLHPPATFKANVKQEAKRICLTTSRMMDVRNLICVTAAKYLRREYPIQKVNQWIREAISEEMSHDGWTAQRNAQMTEWEPTEGVNPFIQAAGHKNVTEYIKGKRRVKDINILPLRLPFSNQMQAMKLSRQLHELHEQALAQIRATKQVDPERLDRLHHSKPMVAWSVSRNLQKHLVNAKSHKDEAQTNRQTIHAKRSLEKEVAMPTQNSSNASVLRCKKMRTPVSEKPACTST